MFSRISDEINEIIQIAKQQESIGRYDDAAKILAKYWKNTSQRPDVSELNREEEAEILLRCGSLARHIGICQQKKDVQKLAKTLLSEALDIFSICGDFEKVAECSICLALVYLRLGQLDEARSWINNAFKYELDKNREVYFYVYNVEGMLLFEEGKYTELVNKCKVLEPLFRGSSFYVLQGDFNNQYAYGLMKLGDKEEAIKRFTLAKYFYTKTKHYLYLALLENNLAIFYKGKGLYAEAHDFAESARENFNKLGDKTREGYSIDTQAQIYLAEGNYEEALKCAEQAIGILKRGENYSYLVYSMETKSHIQLYLKDYAESVKTIVEAIKIVSLFSKKTDKRISIIEEKISSNFQKRWKMEELAEIVNLSKSRFEKLFKQELKISPMQFIKHLRLEKAKELLKTTLLTVKEIGFAVGINDQSGFVRDFKKKYGLTPTEYRKSFKS
jgi:AraC-like DNA-binding protein